MDKNDMSNWSCTVDSCGSCQISDEAQLECCTQAIMEKCDCLCEMLETKSQNCKSMAVCSEIMTLCCDMMTRCCATVQKQTQNEPVWAEMQENCKSMAKNCQMVMEWCKKG